MPIIIGSGGALPCLQRGRPPYRMLHRIPHARAALPLVVWEGCAQPREGARSRCRDKSSTCEPGGRSQWRPQGRVNSPSTSKMSCNGDLKERLALCCTQAAGEQWTGTVQRRRGISAFVWNGGDRLHVLSFCGFTLTSLNAGLAEAMMELVIGRSPCVNAVWAVRTQRARDRTGCKRRRGSGRGESRNHAIFLPRHT